MKEKILEKLKSFWEKVKEKAADIWDTVSKKAVEIWNTKGILILVVLALGIVCLLVISSIIKTVKLTSQNANVEVADKQDMLVDDLSKKEEKDKKDTVKEEKKELSKKEQEELEKEEDEKEDKKLESVEFEFFALKDFDKVTAIRKAYSDTILIDGNHGNELASDDYYIAETKAGCGLIDSKGNWVLKPEYTSIAYTGRGYLLEKGDHYYVFTNETISEATSDYVESEINDREGYGCALDVDYNTLCILDTNNLEILDFKYQQSMPLAVCQIKIDGEAYDVNGTIQSKYKVSNAKFAIASKNKCVTNFEYEYATAFSDGLIAVCNKDGKWGYLNEKGETVLEFRYEGTRKGYSPILEKSVDFAPACINGYITVCKRDKYAVYNKDGERVVPFSRYDYISEVTDGRCFVLLDGKWGMICLNDKKLKGTLQKNKYTIKTGDLLEASEDKDKDDEDKDKDDEDDDDSDSSEKDKKDKKDKDSVSSNTTEE